MGSKLVNIASLTMNLRVGRNEARKGFFQQEIISYFLICKLQNIVILQKSVILTTWLIDWFAPASWSSGGRSAVSNNSGT